MILHCCLFSSVSDEKSDYILIIVSPLICLFLWLKIFFLYLCFSEVSVWCTSVWFSLYSSSLEYVTFSGSGGCSMRLNLQVNIYIFSTLFSFSSASWTPLYYLISFLLLHRLLTWCSFDFCSFCFLCFSSDDFYDLSSSSPILLSLYSI